MVLLAPDSTKAAALLADGRVEAVVLGAFGDDLLALCQANGVEVRGRPPGVRTFQQLSAHAPMAPGGRSVQQGRV